MTPAQARADRAKTLREIAAQVKRANRAQLVKLRERVRELRRERVAAIRQARSTCSRKAAGIPTTREALAMLRAARLEARASCATAKARAARIKDDTKRARAEREAERAHQAHMRLLDRQHKQRQRPSVAKAVQRQESDDEVRGNIPPELVALFDRVKRQIHGSTRRTRTEAFLDYAHEHPDEEYAAIEAKTDEMIRAFERGQRRANPDPLLSRVGAESRPMGKDFALDHAKMLREAGYRVRAVQRGGRWVVRVVGKPRRSNPKKIDRGRQVELFMPASGQLEIVPSHQQKKLVKESAEKRTVPLFPKDNPRRPPGAWWRDCVRRVAAKGRVRRVRAVCGAAWWKMPEAHRAEIVRALERSKSATHRGAAVALSLLEEKHRPARERRRNPRELVELVYEEQKPGDSEPFEYVHRFEGERPQLRMRGGALQVEGGTYRTRDGWIHG